MMVAVRTIRKPPRWKFASPPYVKSAMPMPIDRMTAVRDHLGFSMPKQKANSSRKTIDVDLHIVYKEMPGYEEELVRHCAQGIASICQIAEGDG